MWVEELTMWANTELVVVGNTKPQVPLPTTNASDRDLSVKVAQNVLKIWTNKKLNTFNKFLANLWVSWKKLHLTPLVWTTNVILSEGTRLGIE